MSTVHTRQDATRRVVVVTSGLSQPSTTRLLADRLEAAVVRAGEVAGVPVETEVVEVRDHAHALTDHLLTGFASGELAGVLARVAAADALVVVTPVFSASYAGLFKTFVDVLDRDALRGTPVLLAATAGTSRHSLVLEHALRPLFSYLRAVTVPTAVFAATDDFGATDGGELADRVERAAGELVGLLGGATAPVARRAPALPGPDEEFGEVIAFEDLLKR